MKSIFLTAILLLCVSISSAAVITGVVIDASNSKPIGQVKVSIDSVHFIYSDRCRFATKTVDFTLVKAA
jgi:hypothetical protein